MKFKMSQVPEEGLHLEGEDSPSIMDISETLFRFEKPVRYEFDLTWVGKRSLLVQGRISTIVRAQCVRTLEWFDLPLIVEDFQHHVDFKGDEVDLTEEIREDILLLLPANPISPEAKSVKTEQSPQPKGGSEVWEKLDQLKLK